MKLSVLDKIIASALLVFVLIVQIVCHPSLASQFVPTVKRIGKHIWAI